MSRWKKFGPVLGLAIVILMASAYTTAMPVQTSQELPGTVGDLATITRIEIAENSTVVLAASLGPEEQDGNEFTREARLEAESGTAHGEVEIEIDAADRTRQEIEVEVEGLTPQTTYQVLLDGQVAGIITTDERGEGSVDLSRGRGVR